MDFHADPDPSPIPQASRNVARRGGRSGIGRGPSFKQQRSVSGPGLENLRFRVSADETEILVSLVRWKNAVVTDLVNLFSFLSGYHRPKGAWNSGNDVHDSRRSAHLLAATQKEVNQEEEIKKISRKSLEKKK